MFYFLFYHLFEIFIQYIVIILSPTLIPPKSTILSLPTYFLIYQVKFVLLVYSLLNVWSSIGVRPVYINNTHEENRLSFSQMLSITLVRDKSLSSPLLAMLRFFSALRLWRYYACYHNCFEFICVTKCLDMPKDNCFLVVIHHL